jgi:hypothetical protein
MIAIQVGEISDRRDNPASRVYELTRLHLDHISGVANVFEWFSRQSNVAGQTYLMAACVYYSEPKRQLSGYS